MSDQEDGLFGFNFDDDVFVTKEEREQVKVEKIEYEAKVETDGWFLDTEKSLDEIMLEQHGPNQIKSVIDYHYLHKRYDEALTAALGFLRVATTNKDCKVTGTKEISEIAMHCAAKVNRLDILKELLNNKSHTQDTGLFLVRMKFFPLVGQYTEAMNACVTYHKERKLDYRVWYHMADIFMKSAARDSGEYKNEMRYHLANLSMVRAIHIFTISRWNTRIDFVKRRFETELKVLQDRLECTRRGNADRFVDWMTQDHAGKEESGLDEFSWEDIEWIFSDWVLRQDIDLLDDDVKAVKDM
ncbi:hypothetical protein EDC94DRAFT_612575 [Helicostylum pulchrum]|uniref:Uncharacterized protein n=1 Tax=Helicostylum pulchrum TaxID=562976 RepID=A0ABP9XMV7_9FUNG|nr:hypothetical protein EDC94DRAFT_612575 [Helicostylum pulchrum]